MKYRGITKRLRTIHVPMDYLKQMVQPAASIFVCFSRSMIRATKKKLPKPVLQLGQQNNYHEFPSPRNASELDACRTKPRANRAGL